MGNFGSKDIEGFEIGIRPNGSRVENVVFVDESNAFVNPKLYFLSHGERINPVKYLSRLYCIEFACGGRGLVGMGNLN